MKSTHQSILERISQFSDGEVFFPEAFLEFGNDESVRQALSRLCREGTILRIAKGIYYKPKMDKDFGLLMPSVDRIAKSIAERDKCRVTPTGIYALNRLGLSTQIPMKVTFLTDGTPRKITIGKQTIAFRHSSPKIFHIKDERILLIMSALKELGQDNVKDEYLQQIGNILTGIEEDTVRQDILLTPAWIRKIINGKINTKP